MQTVIFMKDNERIVIVMGMEFIFIRMVLGIRVNGGMINRMGREKKYGRMGLSIKEIIIKEKRRDKAIFNGLMALVIQENSKKIIFVDSVFINGRIKGDMRGCELIIRCMVKVYLNGLMGGNILVNLIMIKKKEKECMNGLMVVNTLAGGYKENNMEKE